jgi:hypothetical protein
MSKATIKMCLATTGFGSQVNLQQARSPAVTTVAESPFQSFTPQATPQMDPKNPNFAYALRRGSTRQPKFDSDLRSLFSEEESAGRPFQRYGQLQQFQLNQLRQQSYPPMTSTAMLPLEQIPPENAVNSDPTSALSNSYMAVNNNSQTVSAVPTNYQQMPQQTDIYSTLSPWSELDFLDSVSIPDQVESTAGAMAPDPLGLDMGFGLGWDGSLPNMSWNNEPGSVDVFDGFFFGGTGIQGQDQF